MKRDARINARSLNLRNFLAIFFLMAFVSAATLTVFTAATRTPVTGDFVPAVTGLVLAISAAGCGLFALFRRQVLMRPVERLCAAARRVAKGDFSARVEPMRTDGKKDEFEVLFDDFNTMVAELGSIETLKTDFIANVSHEMKTPLAVIQNYAELLQTPGLSEPDRARYAAVVEETAGKMAALISNVLRLNRLENQKLVPERAEFDLCRQLADCLLRFEPRWEEKRLEIDVDMEDSAPVRADASLLELVWNNLMSNAIKFTELGGAIAVRQWTEGDQVVVSFADTGCGMGEEARRHIFDKFYQGDSSHATEGNGLGLALVARVLTLLDGEIAVESEPGKGSAFTVRLPVARI